MAITTALLICRERIFRPHFMISLMITSNRVIPRCGPMSRQRIKNRMARFGICTPMYPVEALPTNTHLSGINAGTTAVKAAATIANTPGPRAGSMMAIPCIRTYFTWFLRMDTSTENPRGVVIGVLYKAVIHQVEAEFTHVAGRIVVQGVLQSAFLRLLNRYSGRC